jgi:hypothetical protein
LKISIASAAFATGITIAGAAMAQVVPANPNNDRVSGVPTAIHRGIDNFAFGVVGAKQSYVIPMSSLGAVAAALHVDDARAHGESISFYADCTNQISYHLGNSGCYAHDVDD